MHLLGCVPSNVEIPSDFLCKDDFVMKKDNFVIVEVGSVDQSHIKSIQNLYKQQGRDSGKEVWILSKHCVEGIASEMK
jgi:hypothetical protein